VRFLSILTAFLIAYAFLVIGFAMDLVPADFWVKQVVDGQEIDMNLATLSLLLKFIQLFAASRRSSSDVSLPRKRSINA